MISYKYHLFQLIDCIFIKYYICLIGQIILNLLIDWSNKMSTNIVELYLHGKGDVHVIEAKLEETLFSLLERLDALPINEEVVYIGESVETEEHDDAEEDNCVPADLHSTLQSLNLAQLKHIHTKAPKKIKVDVSFNGATKSRKFSPNATVAKVTAWAIRKFKIDPSSSNDLVLSLVPSNTVPRPDKHLGELVPGAHELAFTLIREITPQG